MAFGEPYNIEVQSPDEFVRMQATLNPRLFLEHFLRRAVQRNTLSIERGQGELKPADLAMFLRDGPSNMHQTAYSHRIVPGNRIVCSRPFAWFSAGHSHLMMPANRMV